MEKNVIFPIFAIGILCLTGCDTQDDYVDEQPYFDSYITVFTPADSISSIDVGRGGYIDWNKRTLEFNSSIMSPGFFMDIFISSKTTYSPYYYEVPNYKLSRDKFNEYITLLGDTSFHKAHRRYGMLDGDGAIVISDTLKSVSITCDKTIDKDHPANSELRGMFKVFYDDFYYIVKNGYKSYTGPDAFTCPDRYMDKHFPYAFRCEDLSSVDFPNRPFFSHRLLLYSKLDPVTPGVYTFMVKITKKNGTSLERSIAYTVK
jgi:hypothetical protein